MRSILINLWYCLLVALVFWPWGIAVVDLAAWILTGHPLSQMPWGNNGRTFVALAWPPVALCISTLFA